MSASRSAVVVGVDGSEPAAIAAMWAATEAIRRHAPLDIVAAYSMLPPLYPAPEMIAKDIADGLYQATLDALAGAEQRVLEQHPHLDVRTRAVNGHPVTVLEEASRSAVLTVVGSRGRGQFAGALLGSTAARMAPRAHSPVVVVRPGAGEWAQPATSPLLVGVDGSSDAQAALAFAFDEAALRGTSLLAVHAWTIEPWVLHRSAMLHRANSDRRAADERRLLSEQLAGWGEKYPDVPVATVLAEGNAAEVLLERTVGYTRPQLVVVGSRGRGGFAGMLIGSVSIALLTHAGCPVAVVRNREHTEF